MVVSLKNKTTKTELQETYLWYFDTNEGYGREQFICIAKTEIEVLELYNNPNKIEDCNKDVILNGYKKLSDNKPLVFNNILFNHRRSDNQLKLITKIKIYNTLSQIIYDTTS